METDEKVLFSNSFGSVTDKRIVLNYKSGAEDIPIGQITSISYQHRRNTFFVIINFLIVLGGLVGIFLGTFTTKGNLGAGGVLAILLVVIFALLSGIANWIGHHHIKISAGGKDRKPLKAEMSKTREGREFVNAVKKAVIK